MTKTMFWMNDFKHCNRILFPTQHSLMTSQYSTGQVSALFWRTDVIINRNNIRPFLHVSYVAYLPLTSVRYWYATVMNHMALALPVHRHLLCVFIIIITCTWTRMVNYKACGTHHVKLAMCTQGQKDWHPFVHLYTCYSFWDGWVQTTWYR